MITNLLVERSCSIILALISLWSALIIITEATLEILYLSNLLPRTDNADQYIPSTIGFYWYANVF